MNSVYQYRNDILREMGFASYRHYLSSALWKSIRARVIQRANGICECCRREAATQAHHRAYDPATLRGDNIDSLTAACGRCHVRAEKPWRAQHSSDRLADSSEALMTHTAALRFNYVREPRDARVYRRKDRLRDRMKFAARRVALHREQQAVLDKAMAMKKTGTGEDK